MSELKMTRNGAPNRSRLQTRDTVPIGPFPGWQQSRAVQPNTRLLCGAVGQREGRPIVPAKSSRSIDKVPQNARATSGRRVAPMCRTWAGIMSLPR